MMTDSTRSGTGRRVLGTSGLVLLSAVFNYFLKQKTFSKADINHPLFPQRQIQRLLRQALL